LARALRDVLADPLDDPFATEIVAVPTRGIERWLSQRLSHHLGASAGGNDGVCANVLFPQPHRLVTDVLIETTGGGDEFDRWRPERSVWQLLQLADGLPAAVPTERRLSVMRHVARLFERYALNRPDLLQSWTDGSSAELTTDHAWQADMWRRLREL